jgi:L-asparaginase
MPRSHRPSLPAHLQIIHTGGTLGCGGSPLAPLPAECFVPILSAQISTLWQGSFAIDTLTPLLDSTQAQPEDWVHLAQQILHRYADGQRHFLVIHGTDTLAYTATWLAECLAGSDIQVVLTGSQYPLLDPISLQPSPTSDAQDNLSTAIAALCQAQHGVFVSFCGETWPAQTVQKIHSRDVAAFSGHLRAGDPANSYRALTLREQAIWQQHAQTQLHQASEQLSKIRVCTYYASPKPYAQLAAELHALAQLQPDAVLLIGYGAGNFPEHPEIRHVLQQLTSDGVLVVASTSVPFGGTTQGYATGHWLSEIGVLPTARLTIAAIYVRLLWICALQSTPANRRKRWLSQLDQATTPHSH